MLLLGLNGATPDSRFFRKLKDFREYKDPDPLGAGFYEKKTVSQERIKVWQKQFEEENKDQELPYDRTNLLYRAVPNWFVRRMLKIREEGGLKTYLVHSCIFFGTIFLCGFLNTFIRVAPSQALKIDSLR